MDFEQASSHVGLIVDSYELSPGKSTPVLSHIFWGETLDEAVGYAQAHLLSDYFFSASWLGQVAWSQGEIAVHNEGRLLGVYSNSDAKRVSSILSELEKTADKVVGDQVRLGVVRAVRTLSQ